MRAGGHPTADGGWLWFRKSGFVAVEKVRISGVAGPQGHAIEAALRQAAHGMSTLDLDTAALREAVAQFAIVRGLHTSTHFPHTLVIAVTERPAVAALVVGGVRTAVAADGLVLGPAILTSALPRSARRWQPQPGQSVHEGGVLAELAVLGAAPKALAARVSSVYTGAHGVTVAMRNGLLVYFGDAERAHAKWLALERVLLDEGSAGAGYIDVRLPERPAAGGFAGRRPTAAQLGAVKKAPPPTRPPKPRLRRWPKACGPTHRAPAPARRWAPTNQPAGVPRPPARANRRPAAPTKNRLRPRAPAPAQAAAEAVKRRCPETPPKPPPRWVPRPRRAASGAHPGRGTSPSRQP